MPEPQNCPRCRNREKPMRKVGNALYYCEKCGFIIYPTENTEPNAEPKRLVVNRF